MVLSMINKTSADKITSQISMSFKNTLGLNKQLSKEVMYGWLHELSPQERSELTIMRLLRKLKQSNMKCVNHNIFLNELKIIPYELKENYMNEQISMKALKSKIIENRNEKLGIKYPNPFEQLETNDLEWLRLVSGELEIFRWKDKQCKLCKENLNTSHILQCKGTSIIRREIECTTDMDAVSVIKDPSLLNKLPKQIRKQTKAATADKISSMILSAGR